MAETKMQTEPVVVTQIRSAATTPKLTLAEVRAKLDGQTGRRFWKNLDELAETPSVSADDGARSFRGRRDRASGSMR